MASSPLQVVAIGNAIVDVLAPIDDAVLDRFGLAKGSMRLCDAAEAAAIYAAMGPGREISGGSAANTAVGVASFGGHAAFVGKVRDDQLGGVFAHDIRAAGVTFSSPPATEGPPTAQSLVLISPDAQRTMNTYLGVAGLLGPDDLPVDLLGATQVVYLEGYLWEEGSAKAAIQRAIELVHAAGGKVAFTLSDSFCVERNRDDFLALIEGPVDILFANEAELCSQFSTDDFETAVAAVRGKVELAAVTRGEQGSVLVSADDHINVAAEPLDAVVDTTGAGDLYAAGVLHGLTSGLDLPGAGRLGSIAAAEVISHVGARPERRLADLV